jgi:hypothetical protein
MRSANARLARPRVEQEPVLGKTVARGSDEEARAVSWRKGGLSQALG